MTAAPVMRRPRAASQQDREQRGGVERAERDAVDETADVRRRHHIRDPHRYGGGAAQTPAARVDSIKIPESAPDRNVQRTSTRRARGEGSSPLQSAPVE